MKYYLSSFRTGNETEKLIEMASHTNKRVAFFTNAMDYMEDLETRAIIEGHDKGDLTSLGLEVKQIDMREYFGKEDALREIVETCDIIWCVGGNSFVLLQAMRATGLDKIMYERHTSDKPYIYGGFSAGASILGPTLDGIHLTDEPDKKPYGDAFETRWDGLGLVDYVIVPHYKSDRFKDLPTEEAIQVLINNKTLFIAIEDGDVIIVE